MKYIVLHRSMVIMMGEKIVGTPLSKPKVQPLRSCDTRPVYFYPYIYTSDTQLKPRLAFMIRGACAWSRVNLDIRGTKYS